MDKKVILLDLEGTLYTRQGVIDGAIQSVNLLREKYTIRFITNTDSKTQHSVYLNLKEMGFNVHLNEVYTPSRIINTYLLNEIKSAYFLTSKELKDEFRENGEIVESYNSEVYPSHVVIGDIREALDYNSINTAFRYLQKDTKLIVLQEGLFYLSKGEKNIDTGSFVNIFNKEAKENRILVGKPSSVLLSAIMNELEIKDKKKFIIVGDDIFSDILMGNKFGIETVLVKTGKFDIQNVLSTSIKPNYLLDSICSLNELMEE